MASDGILLSGYQGQAYAIRNARGAAGRHARRRTPRTATSACSTRCSTSTTPTRRPPRCGRPHGAAMTAGVQAESVSLEIHPIAPGGSRLGGRGREGDGLRGRARAGLRARGERRRCSPAGQDWTPATICRGADQGRRQGRRAGRLPDARAGSAAGCTRRPPGRRPRCRSTRPRDRYDADPGRYPVHRRSRRRHGVRTALGDAQAVVATAKPSSGSTGPTASPTDGATASPTDARRARRRTPRPAAPPRTADPGPRAAAAERRTATCHAAGVAAAPLRPGPEARALVDAQRGDLASRAAAVVGHVDGAAGPGGADRARGPSAEGGRRARGDRRRAPPGGHRGEPAPDGARGRRDTARPWTSAGPPRPSSRRCRGSGRQTARSVLAAVAELSTAIGETKHVRIAFPGDRGRAPSHARDTALPAPLDTELLTALARLQRLEPAVEPHRAELTGYARPSPGRLGDARRAASRWRLARSRSADPPGRPRGPGRLDGWQPWLEARDLPGTLADLERALRDAGPRPRRRSGRTTRATAPTTSRCSSGSCPVRATWTFGGLAAELAERVAAHPLDTSLLPCSCAATRASARGSCSTRAGSLLGDEMGLGKTVQAIAVMADRAAAGPTHALVVCPASVLVGWEREVAAHSRLVPHRLHGPGRDAALARWRAEGGVAITTYEGLEHVPRPVTTRPGAARRRRGALRQEPRGPAQQARRGLGGAHLAGAADDGHADAQPGRGVPGARPAAPARGRRRRAPQRRPGRAGGVPARGHPGLPAAQPGRRARRAAGPGGRPRSGSRRPPRGAHLPGGRRAAAASWRCAAPRTPLPTRATRPSSNGCWRSSRTPRRTVIAWWSTPGSSTCSTPSHVRSTRTRWPPATVR